MLLFPSANLQEFQGRQSWHGLQIVPHPLPDSVLTPSQVLLAHPSKYSVLTLPKYSVLTPPTEVSVLTYADSSTAV